MPGLPLEPAPAAHPRSDDHKTLLWWTLLRAIAVANVLAWLATAAMVELGRADVRVQLGLSGIYVLVCAFRSFLPRIDLERTCLVDSPWSSMALGRSAATVAEVSFAAQVGLLVHMMGTAAGIGWVQALGGVLVMLLATAQVFCWSSVIRLSHLGHAIEESLWALSFALVALAAGVCLPGLDGVLAVAAGVAVPACIAYVAFMVVVDVPMYLRRWREGKAAGIKILGVREGLQDAMHRRHPTRSWAVWKPEVAWLTGYFSFAVWGSLALVHLTNMAG